MANRSLTLKVQNKPIYHSRSSINPPLSTRKPQNFPEKEFKSVKTLNITTHSPKKTEVDFSKVDNQDRQKNFMEMMGFHKKTDTYLKSSPLNIDILAPSISLVDFMGENRLSFLKKAGFMPIHDECVRSQEVKKIADEKNAFSLPNILHYDMIRESTIKTPINSHSVVTPNFSLLPKLKIQPNTVKAKSDKECKFFKGESEHIGKIDKILEECEILYKENKELRKIENEIAAKSGLEKIQKKKGKRRLTIKEINSIRLNAQALD
ncbi:hypothetical protein SteCoe_9329 [Stentor coeruleus]|uniref:Uncharacterized protein n=1 Tax=Stentor coeruleus TaxID=5963 RepID=A0A1R2CIC2_9CILI|nr:hypothetical protein SteCoe_9329 [Stentor coeruleus]